MAESIVFIIVLILIIWLLRRRRKRKKQNSVNQNPTEQKSPEQKPTEQKSTEQKSTEQSGDSKLYADVFVYPKESGSNGRHVYTYIAMSKYLKGELVVVELNDKISAGRIVQTFPSKPTGIPRGTRLKTIIKKLEESDLPNISNYGPVLKKVLEKEPL